ncbi:MAG TPA: hypothetical protein VF621_06335, partial [Pyrinomonadaceae bacterium]
MITGFNTDIPYDGVTYHVQTEDKGLDTPLILSLVYVGGAIIASKRTPYADLISRGFDESVLTERLQRQHKLICAAIKSGRIDDLKRMSGPNGGPAQADAPEAARKAGAAKRKRSEAPEQTPAQTPAPAATAPPVERPAPLRAEEAAPVVPRPPAAAPPEAVPPTPQALAAPPLNAQPKAEPDLVILSTLADEISTLDYYRIAPATKETAAPEPAPPPPAPVPVEPIIEAVVVEEPEELSDDIYLSLLDDEGEFRAGQLVTIKIYVGRGTYGQRPVGGASLTVKVLGTSFRPIIVTTTTDEHGVGVVRALLPRFNSGRAAIIIRAVAGDNSAEMRRI